MSGTDRAPDMRDQLYESALRLIRTAGRAAAAVGTLARKRPDMADDLQEVSSEVAALALAACDLTALHQASTEPVPPISRRA